MKSSDKFDPKDFSHSRNVSVVAWEVFVSSVLTGSHKTLRTNTSKSSALIHTTTPSVVTRKSTGFAIQLRNIASCVDLHPPERALVVLAKAIATHRPLVDLVVLLGVVRTVSTCADIVKHPADEVLVLVALEMQMKFMRFMIF